MLVDPVEFFIEIIKLKRRNDGPLFLLLKWQTYYTLSSLHRFTFCVEIKNFDTHSFRFDAATSAFLIGKWGGDDIERLGQWSSTCFQRYIRRNY